MMNADEALEALRAGNARYVEDGQRPTMRTDEAQRDALVAGQSPIAIILGCSDSRVPAELVFDQGLGRLFVIRVAGNIVDASQIASVEFAAKVLGTQLVVVMGHSNCGAVAATLAALDNPSPDELENIHAIVDRIRPAIEKLRASPLRTDPQALLTASIRANVESSVEGLRTGSRTLSALLEAGSLRIVGAQYDLESGVVTFFDDA